MRVTNAKNCYCRTCDKDFHYLGITRHRAMHRDRKEDCEITYTYGDTYVHRYSQKKGIDMVKIQITVDAEFDQTLPDDTSEIEDAIAHFISRELDQATKVTVWGTTVEIVQELE